MTLTQQIYKGIADKLREMLETETDEAARADLEENIFIYDHLTECSERGRFKIIDTGIYNNVIEGYLLLTLDHIARDAEEGRDGEEVSDSEEARKEADRIRRRAPGALSRILDTYGAKRAEEYSFSHQYTRGEV